MCPCSSEGVLCYDITLLLNRTILYPLERCVSAYYHPIMPIVHEGMTIEENSHRITQNWRRKITFMSHWTAQDIQKNACRNCVRVGTSIRQNLVLYVVFH